MVSIIEEDSKMATWVVHDDSPGDISYICGAVDQDIEGILLGYGRDDNRDLERMMVDDCEKQMLLNTRDKIFDLAKEKMLRCLGKQKAGKPESDATDNDPHEETELTASFIEKWRLIPRRAEHKMAHDIIEMIAFTLGSKGTFPKIIKESSMNKGVVDDDNDGAELMEKLNKDLEAADGQVEIQVIAANERSQLHSVCLQPVEAPGVPGPEATNEGEGADVDTTANDTVDDPRGKEVAERDNPDASHKHDPPTNAQAPVVVSEAISEKTPLREVRVCVCAESVVKKVREMACQTDEDERPIFRSEFDHQTGYANRKMRVNEQNIKGILKWKSLVNNRFRDVEKAHDREVIAMRAQYRTLAVEFAEFKSKNKKGNADVIMKEKEVVIEREIDQMDVGDEWDDNDGSGEESIWDMQPGQSTPAVTRSKKTVENTPKPKRGAGTGGARRVQTQPKPQREKAAIPPKSTPAHARKAPLRNNQKAVRVDIEMVEVNESSSQSESSSEGEPDEPEQAKSKSGGSGDRKVVSGSNTGVKKGDTATPLTSRLRVLSETPVENEVEMSECDSSWAEQDEEPMLVDIAANGSACSDDTPHDDNPDEKGGKNVRFNVVSNKRGVKRGGEARVQDKKRGESSKNGVCISDEASENSSQEHDSFAEIVSRYGRSKIDWNKKRREAVATKKRSLKGIKSILQREIYVQGIDFEGFASYSEMEELIHGFCLKKGVPVIYMKIIPAKYDRAQVGCKIAVREMDFDKVMDECFWPDDVSVREWRNKPRNDRGFDGYGEGAY